VKLFLDFLFSFLDLVKILFFLAQGQSWMIFFWCVLFTYDGPTYMTNAFFCCEYYRFGKHATRHCRSACALNTGSQSMLYVGQFQRICMRYVSHLSLSLSLSLNQMRRTR